MPLNSDSDELLPTLIQGREMWKAKEALSVRGPKGMCGFGTSTASVPERNTEAFLSGLYVHIDSVRKISIVVFYPTPPGCLWLKTEETDPTKIH